MRKRLTILASMDFLRTNILPQFVQWLFGSRRRPGSIARIQIVLLPLPVLGVLLEVLGDGRSNARVELLQLLGFPLKASI